MSERIFTTVTAPSGRIATPVSQLQALNDGIGQLETDAFARELRPIWDTLEIQTETEEIDDRSFADAAHARGLHSFTTHTLSILTIDPKEVSE